MNNEPVAWMELYYGEPNNLSWTDAELRNSGEVYKTIPLYTHPVNPKYDPETGEPLIDGYPLFSGLPHPVKEQEPTVPKNMQEWKGMDGATAYLLIDRHADNWADAKQMMEEWLEANSNLVNPYKVITDTKIEPTVVSYTHPVKEQGNPVAWRSQDPDGYWSVYQSPVEGAEPLYTGFKELTDEEIMDESFKAGLAISKDTDVFLLEHDVEALVTFARAILRKANEK